MTLGIIIVVLALLYALTVYVLPYAIIKPGRFDVLEFMEEYPDGIYPSDYGLAFEAEEVLIDDGIALNGYMVFTPVNEVKGTILFLHGIGGVKEGFLAWSAFLAKQGFNSFLFDARAHGQSGDNFCTYGAREKYDVVKVIDYLEENYGVQHFGIWGSSMGGAVALQALEIEPRLKFGVIESSFANFRQIVYDYQRRITKIGFPWLMDLALVQAGRLAKFDPDAVVPVNAAKKVTQPVFMAHGEVDERIKVAYSQEIFENLASIQKELVIVKQAGHYELSSIGGQDYQNKILQFLNKTLLGLSV